MGRKAVKEVWKPIPFLPNYEASNLGRIRHKLLKNIRKFELNTAGYFRVTVRVSNKKLVKYLVHRCVAAAFLGWPPKPGLQINHKDKNKTNNHVSNLEWVTARHNSLHRSRFKLFKHYGKSIKDGKKLTRLQVVDFKLDLAKGLSNKELSKKYKVSISMVSKIRNGHCWSFEIY